MNIKQEMIRVIKLALPECKNEDENLWKLDIDDLAKIYVPAVCILEQREKDEVLSSDRIAQYLTK